MNVVILIEGREAIPVRAIPFLANWRFMSPDIVAHVLGGTGGSNVGLFGEMQSNRIEDGKVQHLKKDDWVQFPLKELQALSEKIKADESSHAVGYSEWRKQSLKVLPAGVFVWKDEYQALHDKNWNCRYKMTYCALRDWNSEGEAEESDEENESPIQRKLTREELVEGIALKRDLRESLEILNRWREPSYSPFMLPELCAVVMEGFEQPSLEDHQTVQNLLVERDELKANIKRWDAKDDSLPSETLIKEKELERLRARLAKVEEKIRAARGDYFDTSELSQSTASSTALTHAASVLNEIPQPIQRTAAQDAAILSEIQKLGIQPLQIPKNIAGRPGVKAKIRIALSSNNLFAGSTVFNKAWVRMTGAGDIALKQ